MKKYLLFAFAISTLVLASCGKVTSNSTNSSISNNSSINSESSDDSISDKQLLDVFIFMGQSNMAGRGIEFEEAIPCEENHAYEYRAVTGSDDEGWLYPVVEPFGKYENNEALTDGNNGDGKKSGGIVSSFCESYYQETGIPVVAVSASVGGTSINEWVPGTSYFNESKRRLREALDYVDSLEDAEVRYINMVWCQGESDSTNFASGKLDYNSKLISLYEGLEDIGNGWGVEHCFLIPPSEYSSGQSVDAKVKMIENQINLCKENEDFILSSLKFRNVPKVLRDDPHFHQGVYNVCGWDAGKNVASYLKTEQEPECLPFEAGEEIELAEKFGITLTVHS